MTSGPPALPERETGRGPQHGGKARSAAKTPTVLPCEARVIWRRPDCLNPSLQWWKSAHPPTRRLTSGPPASDDSGFRHLNPPGRRATGSELVQGDGPGRLRHARYVQRIGEFGMAYGARALWSRSVRSSRRSHDLPGRTGKPSARAKLRRLTRRWIAPAGSRGSEGACLWVTRPT